MEDESDPVLPVSKSETELLERLYDKYFGRAHFIDAFELHQILKELIDGVLDTPYSFR